MPTEFGTLTSADGDGDTRDSRDRARAFLDLRTSRSTLDDPEGPRATAARTLHGDQPRAASAISSTMGGTEGASLEAMVAAGNTQGGTVNIADAFATATGAVDSADSVGGERARVVAQGTEDRNAERARARTELIEAGRTERSERHALVEEGRADRNSERAAAAAGHRMAAAAQTARLAAATGIPEDAPNYVPLDGTTGEYSWMEFTPPSPREISRSLAQRRHIVRRPTMGIVGYSNRYATMEVIVRNGTETGEYLELFNSSYRSARHTVNSNFIVQRVHEELSESAAIVQTLGDWYLSDSGEVPRMFKISGTLIESQNFPWVQEFRKNYEKYLRARQCILRRAQVYLTIDDMMYVGYVIGASMARDATVSWPYVPFSMTMVLRRVEDVRAVNVFPDVPNPEDYDLVDPKTGDLFREGIRVATLQPDTSSIGKGLSVESLAEVSPYLGVGTAYTYSTASNGLAGEIVHGAKDGEAGSTKSPFLEYKGDIGPAETRIDANALVALARRMNAMSGRTMFNIQNVRTGYFAGRRADFENLGITNQDALAKFGFPTSYQQEVDARRRRQQEEYRSAIETAVRLTRDAAENLRAEVRWL